MERLFLVLAGVLGALAVGLGAFGAHGLEGMLAGAEDAERRLQWWRTAVAYHLPHALLVAICAWLTTRGDGLAGRVAGFAVVLGVTIFSGTLYAMSLGAPRWLGAVTPLGGLALIVGWVAVIVAALRP